jgi:hypothetical protein
MGDWLVLLPKAQSAPAATRLLDRVKAELDRPEGAAARLHFALVAWQAGAPEAARAELQRITDDEKTAPKLRAIAALRLRQLGVKGATANATDFEGLPTLAEAWAKEQ